MRRLVTVLAILTFLGVLFINVGVRAQDKEMNLENINTRNFKAKMGYLKLTSIKKICSYEYCDYVRGDSFDETIEIFTKNYLKTIEDNEVKASLRIKGIRITKLIFENEKNSP